MSEHRATITVDHEAALAATASRLQREFHDAFTGDEITDLLHTSYSKLAATATVPTYLPLLAERFTRQRMTALEQTGGTSAARKSAVLFLCTHNAGRSQMALGFLNHHAGDHIIGWSGGSEPGHVINPTAVEAMAERGIDITDEYPKPWTEEVLRAADTIITMGCGDTCPYYPGKQYIDWAIPDPDGQDIATVRQIRDEVEQRVLELIVQLTTTMPVR